MKKTISLAMFGAMVLAFASCSNDEVVSQPKSNRAIGFSTFVDNSTRGDLTTSNITAFKVWSGYQYTADGTSTFTSIFNGINVNRGQDGDGNYTNEWSYGDALEYWHVGDAHAYWFAALAGTNYAYTPDFATWHQFGSGSLTFAQTAALGQEDLCYAWKYYGTVSQADASSVVNFTFQHLLSRVTFTFKNAMPNSITNIVISDVKVNNTPSGEFATLTFPSAEGTAPAWSNVTESSLVLPTNIAATHIYNSAENGQAVQETTAPLYLIPYNATASSYTLDFTITVYENNAQGRTYVHTNVPLPAVNYELGKAYNLVAVINPSNIDPTDAIKAIQFSVQTVESWGTPTDVNMTFN